MNSWCDKNLDMYEMQSAARRGDTGEGKSDKSLHTPSSEWSSRHPNTSLPSLHLCANHMPPNFPPTYHTYDSHTPEHNYMSPHSTDMSPMQHPHVTHVPITHHPYSSHSHTINLLSDPGPHQHHHHCLPFTQREILPRRPPASYVWSEGQRSWPCSNYGSERGNHCLKATQNQHDSGSKKFSFAW